MTNYKWFALNGPNDNLVTKVLWLNDYWNIKQTKKKDRDCGHSIIHDCVFLYYPLTFIKINVSEITGSGQ